MESYVSGNFFLSAFYFLSIYSFKNAYLMRKDPVMSRVSVELLKILNDYNAAEE